MTLPQLEMRFPPLPRVASRLFVGLLAVVGALSCQAIFGDYRVDTSSVPPPSIVCERGDTRCDGRVLQSCAPNRLGFRTLETCASESLCNLNTESCDPCTPGDYQCNDGELHRCAADLSWEGVASCVTPSLCWTSNDRRQGSCNTPACSTAGQYRCEAARLQRCSRGLDKWEDVEVCASEQLCDADLANQQANRQLPVNCLPPSCRPGQFFCEAGRLGGCSASLLTWDEITHCDPPELCNIERGDCSACTPGDFACSGTELLRCIPGGAWEHVALCMSAALCDADQGLCNEPACSPSGAIVCEDTLKLRRCRPDQTAWDDLATCLTVGLCDAEERRCEQPACQRDAQRCMGARLERCLPDLTGWEIAERCGPGSFCDSAAGCVTGTCEEGTSRCNDRYLETCVDGGWKRVESCATRELCDATTGLCKPPVCGGSLALHRCRTNIILEVCQPGRDRFADYLTCPPETECDAASGSCR